MTWLLLPRPRDFLVCWAPRRAEAAELWNRTSRNFKLTANTTLVYLLRGQWQFGSSLYHLQAQLTIRNFYIIDLIRPSQRAWANKCWQLSLRLCLQAELREHPPRKKKNHSSYVFVVLYLILKVDVLIFIQNYQAKSAVMNSKKV